MQPIVIAAGGTGGHFFPAEALAAELLSRNERVVLMTDARSAAGHAAVFAGGEIHVIAGAGVAGRSVIRAAKGLASISAGVFAARRIMAPLAPAAVVGFGGYPSVAPMLAARTLRHRPALILHDQNAALGKANRLLARIATKVALSFADTSGVAKSRGVFTGNPVRPAIAASAKSAYLIPAHEIRILVLGGSLGATVFATLIPAALARLPEALRSRIVLTMQCPPAVLEIARAALAGIPVTLAPFFENIPELLQDSHLVIARSGGSTVAELAVIGRPAILIPLTINADQRANADALAQAGGALRVDQSSGDAALGAALETLLTDPVRLAAMAAAAGKMGTSNAAKNLADLTLGLIAAMPVHEEILR